MLLRYQFSHFIKDFSYSKARIPCFVNIWRQKWYQTREVTLFQERYRITKYWGVIVSMAFRCVTLLNSNFCNHFRFYINLIVKIHENFHVKGIFHHDKSNRMKVYTCIYLVSMFFRFVELCVARNQWICFQFILCSVYFKFRLYRKITIR